MTPDHLVSAVAAALAVGEGPGRSAGDSVVAALASSQHHNANETAGGYTDPPW